jgi:hypothetical protein
MPNVMNPTRANGFIVNAPAMFHTTLNKYVKEL